MLLVEAYIIAEREVYWNSVLSAHFLLNLKLF